jgi:hypothetical protein
MLAAERGKVDPRTGRRRQAAIRVGALSNIAVAG